MIAILPNVELEETDTLSDMVLTSALNGVDNTAEMAFENPTLVTDENDDNKGLVTVKFKPVTQTKEEQVVSVTISWKGNEFTKSFRVPATV